MQNNMELKNDGISIQGYFSIYYGFPERLSSPVPGKLILKENGDIDVNIEHPRTGEKHNWNNIKELNIKGDKIYFYTKKENRKLIAINP